MLSILAKHLASVTINFPGLKDYVKSGVEEGRWGFVTEQGVTF